MAVGWPGAEWNWLALQNHHKSPPKLTELLGVLPRTYLLALGQIVSGEGESAPGWVSPDGSGQIGAGAFFGLLPEGGELSAFFDVR